VTTSGCGIRAPRDGHLTTDRRGILILVFVALASYAMIVGLQPYSVRSPWERWDAPGRRYFAAAARLDTTALRRLTASVTAIDWALQTGRTRSTGLDPWATSAHASMGFQRSDTLDVWYDALADRCSYRLSYVGRQRPRVVAAHAWCDDRAGWPTDPTVIKVSR
jgi:hypothetical protein